MQSAAKAALADASLRLKTGSTNEIIIAGERVRIKGDANYKKHSDVAPITFYLETPTEPTVKIIQDIFTGKPDIDEENPLPPCDGSHYNILKSALERRSNLLSDEIEETRKRRVDNIKTHALIRHYRKLEVMLDALDRATGCNKYGQIPADGVTIQQQQRLEDLTRQFAFLVLQGIDPIDLTGDAPLLKKSANAKSLIALLEVNKVTETELTRYLNMRKTIPTFIMNILDGDGAGRASFQKAIDEMVLVKQIEIVLQIIETIKASPIGGDFDDTPIKNLPPIDQITWIINWLVSKYVECNEAAVPIRRNIEMLTARAEELQDNIERLNAENARLQRERDAADARAAAAEAAKARAEGDAARAIREKNELQGVAAGYVIEIQDLTRQLGDVRDQLRAERAKVAAAAGIQATLDNVNRQLRDMTAEYRSLEAQLRITQERATAAEAAAAAATARAAAAEAALAAYKESHPDTGTDELARLRGELAAAKAAETAARAAADAARVDLDRANQRAAAADDAARAANQRATTAEAELARLRGEIAASKAEIADYKGRIAAAVEDLRRLQRENDEIRSRHSGLAGDSAAKDAQIAGISGNAAAAAAAARDALAKLEAKEAELDALKRKCAEEADRLQGLQDAAAAAKRALAEEQAKSRNLLAYLAQLSTAITEGKDPLPPPPDIPQIGDLMTKIKKLRDNGDPSKYLCLLSYYVKFFMNLLFNQRGGKLAYAAIKDYIGGAVGKSDILLSPDECYGLLETLKTSIDAGGSGIDVKDRGLQIILDNIFGESGAYNQAIAVFVVASQLYLAKLNSIGKLPGCRVAAVITDPIGNLPKGGGVAAAAAPAPANDRPAYAARDPYASLLPARDPYASLVPARAAYAPPPLAPAAAPAPARVPAAAPLTEAARRTFNVEDDDVAPSVTPSTAQQIKYAPDAHTKQQAELALKSIQGIIKTAGGASGRAPKPLSTQEKSTYRADSKVIIDYCSYGDSRHPLTRYPVPDSGLCQLYQTTKANLKQVTFDNGLPRL